ncbi:MAG: DnaA N-terminal domain-containing protein, partial [Ktedonobacterales bacterium]
MEATQVWQTALERVRRRVSPSAFTTWFSETVGVELRQRRLTVAVPSTFAEDHLRQRFGELARIAVSEVIGERAELAFVVRPVHGKTPPQPARGRGTSRRDAASAGMAATQSVASTPSTPPAPAAARASTREARRAPAASLAQQVAAAYEARPAPLKASGGPSANARRQAQTGQLAQPPLAFKTQSPQTWQDQRILPTPAPVRAAAVTRPLAEAAYERHPYDAPANIYELNPRYVFET